MNRSSDVRRLVRSVRSASKRLDELRREASGGRRDGQGSAASSTFLRGLVAGALVGAAIAGSTIWERRHPRGRSTGE